MKNNYGLFILLLLLVFFSCIQHDKFIEKIYSSVNDGDFIILGDYTDFTWDNVVLCNPGTSRQDYIKFLGNQGKNFDLNKVIIFRKGEQVVHYIKQDYHPEKPLAVEFYIDTNTYKIFDKDTIFSVKKYDNNTALYPVVSEN